MQPRQIIGWENWNWWSPVHNIEEIHDLTEDK